MSEKMKAVVISEFGGPEVLTLRDDIPRPPMALHNEVMVEIHAAGINPFECKLRRGFLKSMFPFSFPHILGNDVAGVVVAKGFDVSELDVGDRVYGLIDPMRSGAYAEYTAVNSWLLRRMPANLSFAEAASVPMAGMTAWFGLRNLAAVAPGARVLIHAGAGGVGSFAIQVAKHFGAWVAATCGPGNMDYVKSLGADQVIDYTAADFRQVVGDMDIVLDPIGGQVNLRSYEVLRPGGTLLVVLRGDPVEMENRERLMARHKVTTKVIAFSSQPEILDQMTALFENGALKPPHITAFPLDKAAEAHRQSETGHTRGKMVLTVRQAT